MIRLKSGLLAIIAPAAAILVALAVASAIIAATGRSPLRALHLLLQGTIGGPNPWHGVSETLVKSCPLLITGVAVAVAFRCGIWNIGAEGQCLMGMLAAAWLGVAGHPWSGAVLQPAMMAAAFALGALWGGIAGWLKVRRGVAEVISTIMLNFIAYFLISYLVHEHLQEPAHALPETDTIAPQAQLLRPFAPQRFHVGILFALALALGVWVLIFKTVFGYRVRMVGLNPHAARTAGIPVERAIIAAMMTSGGLAGLGGAVEVVGVLHNLHADYWPGVGFTAIAVALIGRLNPLGIIPAALLFGALEAGSKTMEAEGGIPSVAVLVIQGTAVLLIAALPSLLGRGRLPAVAAN